MNSSMAWRQAVGSFLRSGTVISLTGGIIASGTYITYKDYSRYRRMINVYERGNILPPFTENNYEICYFPRKEAEADLQKMFNNSFSNQYYLINGEVGVGKTRLIIETVRKLMSSRGAKRKGAPIYVLYNQGASFPETLAQAVNFQFDEHLSFQFFLDFILRIHAFPSRDNNSRLTRVLNAIEESSFLYMLKTGKPVVLIIDGINGLDVSMPGAVDQIQSKAKLWADTNTVKVVFVNNDEEMESKLQKNSSCWSRIGPPYYIDDLTHDEAIGFLTLPPYCETDADVEKNNKVMSREEAEKVYDLVGGRIIHLVAFKRDYVLGVPHEVTREELMDREREKFTHVSKTPSFWEVVSTLRNSPNKRYPLSKLVKETSAHDVKSLAHHSIIRYKCAKIGTLVRFQSPLTEHVVDELQRMYLLERKINKKGA